VADSCGEVNAYFTSASKPLRGLTREVQSLKDTAAAAKESIDAGQEGENIVEEALISIRTAMETSLPDAIAARIRDALLVQRESSDSHRMQNAQALATDIRGAVEDAITAIPAEETTGWGRWDLAFYDCLSQDPSCCAPRWTTAGSALRTDAEIGQQLVQALAQSFVRAG